MIEITTDQIRNFRLHSHHLDTVYHKSDIGRIAGACGLQNSPPGAWETSLYNRIPGLSLEEMEALLYREKLLLQAWSLRGAPIVFPESESDVFLSALVPEEEEPWIYTRGITLALDFLQLDFETLLELVGKVIPKLDEKIIISKCELDQTVAEWITPLLPEEKQDLWNQPSMYGSPDKQTVGGAAVSFLLRPCSFCRLIVFGEREGISPTFTSYKNWTGRSHETEENTVRADAAKMLARKFLHCYGPSTVDSFAAWLGCSGKQGRRIWKSIEEEMEPVIVMGKKGYILSVDRERLLTPEPISREMLLLGAHDPFLDQRDRLILQPDKSLHKEIWKMVTNPGAIIYRGEIVGIWNGKKKGKKLEIKMNLWDFRCDRQKLSELAEAYASFRGQELVKVEM